MAETVLEDCCGQQCRTPSLPSFQPKAGPTSRPTRLLRTEKADCACARRADKLGAGAMAISGNIEAKWEKMGAVAGEGRRSKARGPEALPSPPFYWLMFTTSVCGRQIRVAERLIDRVAVRSNGPQRSAWQLAGPVGLCVAIPCLFLHHDSTRQRFRAEYSNGCHVSVLQH